MDHMSLREKLVRTAQGMTDSGLSPGRSGNVSARIKGGMLITPSAMAYSEMEPRDIVFVDEDGTSQGALKPSSEWQFHLATYARRADINAHIHAHSLNATVLACAHEPIPAFHYMVAVAGGDNIPIVDYATFGSAQLSKNIADGLTRRDACLIANHGLCAIGPSLEAAFELAHEVETLATLYVRLLSLGTVHILDDEEMTRVIELFKSYGQTNQNVKKSDDG